MLMVLINADVPGIVAGALSVISPIVVPFLIDLL